MPVTARIELARNAAGRLVPLEVNHKSQSPFLGLNQYQPSGTKAAPPIRSAKDYPTNGDKRFPDLESALRRCGLRDGMVISTHHHLRDGDAVALPVLQTAARMGVKDLMWFPAPPFPRTRPSST